MSALTISPRLAILAITGATALSVAALSAPAPAYAQGDHVIGAIASVSGNTFEVTQPNGTAAVEFTDSTKVSEAIPAGRGDVTVGSCVKAGPTAESAPADSGAITAKWVMVSTAVDGKCPQRHPPGATEPSAQHRGVRGIVKSVAGDTVTVTREDAGGNASQATVTLTDTTHYRKRVAANTGAITGGKCVAARGTKDAGGVLQATKVTVWAATDGDCPHPTG